MRLPRSRDAGFSLVELTVVMLVLSVLFLVGMASYARLARIADDEAAKLDAVMAIKVQTLHHVENGRFSMNGPQLQLLEPTLEYTLAGDPGTVAVRVEPAHATTDVCVFVQTKYNDWFAVHRSTTGGDHYAQVAPLPCTPGNVAGWSDRSW